MPAQLKNDFVVRYTEHPVSDGDRTREFGGVMVAVAK